MPRVDCLQRVRDYNFDGTNRSCPLGRLHVAPANFLDTTLYDELEREGFFKRNAVE